MKIAIFGKTLNPNLNDYIRQLFDSLKKSGAEIHVYSSFYNYLKKTLGLPKGIHTFNRREEEIRDYDFFISIGGDGTMLESATIIGDSNTPILGINTGSLGFLSSVSKEDIEHAIKQLHEGSFTIDKRTMIRLESSKQLFGKNNFALNEVTIHKKDTTSMITIHTWINDEYLNAYWADGLIVSTPTGSTGYSLSCGGPIVNPNSESFIITPIAPHNLNVRPIVVSDNSIIKLKAEGRSPLFLISLDSRSETIEPTDELTLRKENFTLNLVRLSNESFISTLRNKLMWGADKRN